jgi:ankyrin repeat protein
LQDPDHDTDVFDAQGRAPLHLAAAGGHLGAVNFLLQKGSFVDMQDWDVSVLCVGGGRASGTAAAPK